MFTIVGLGNPGAEYRLTRHNAGRIVLERVLRKWNWPIDEHAFESGGEVAKGEKARILFPREYMNESGKALRQLLPEEVAKLIVVYDDIDIPLGEYKISFGRGPGGHNGLASVIKALDTRDFTRVRIGLAPRNWWGKVVRPAGDKLSSYVLGVFSKRELAKLEEAAESVGKELEKLINK